MRCCLTDVRQLEWKLMCAMLQGWVGGGKHEGASLMVPWPTWRPQQSCGKQSDALQLPLVETAGRLARGAVTACVLVGRSGQEPGWGGVVGK